MSSDFLSTLSTLTNKSIRFLSPSDHLRLLQECPTGEAVLTYHDGAVQEGDSGPDFYAASAQRREAEEEFKKSDDQHEGNQRRSQVRMTSMKLNSFNKNFIQF